MPTHTEYIYSLYVKSSLLYQHSGLRRNNTENNKKCKTKTLLSHSTVLEGRLVTLVNPLQIPHNTF